MHPFDSTRATGTPFLASLESLGIAHDLRAPLRLAMGEIELALQGELPRDCRSNVEAAEAHLRRMQGFLEDILALGIGLAGPTPPFDPAEAVRDAAQAIGVAIKIEGTGPIAGIRAHDGVFARIAQNLLANAKEHGQEPITCHIDDDGLVIRDAGNGLPAKYQEALVQGNTMPRQGSRGIGLELTRALAQSQGWNLVTKGPFPFVRWTTTNSKAPGEG